MRLSAPFRQRPEKRSDAYRLAVLDDDLLEPTGGGRRHLDRHFVGFELDEGLVACDRIALLFKPLADGRLRHRFSKRRDFDLQGHAAFQLC